MNGKKFYLSRCPVCGRDISSAGFAKVSHYRKHVREGKMVQRLVKYGFSIFDQRYEFDIVGSKKDA